MGFSTNERDKAATKGDIYDSLMGETFGERVDGEVEYYSDLPSASGSSGRIYKVKKRTANYWTLGVTARHLAGYYESTGTEWKFKPNSALPVYNYDGGDNSDSTNYRQFTPKDITEIASKGAGKVVRPDVLSPVVIIPGILYIENRVVKMYRSFIDSSSFRWKIRVLEGEGWSPAGNTWYVDADTNNKDYCFDNAPYDGLMAQASDTLTDSGMYSIRIMLYYLPGQIDHKQLDLHASLRMEDGNANIYIDSYTADENTGNIGCAYDTCV